MIELTIFIITFYFCFFSILGYGYFSKVLFFKNYTTNQEYLIYLGFYGLVLITLISLITSLFVSHNYYHNIILHIIGLILFVKSPIIKQKKFLKNIIIISVILFSILLISKSHDDFSYYHLTYSFLQN